MKKENKIKVWKTLTLGDSGLNSKEEVVNSLHTHKILHKAMRHHHSHSVIINDEGNSLEVFRKFYIDIPKEKKEVKLVKLHTLDMGFKHPERVSYRQLCKRAKEMGLELCDREVAWELALNYSKRDSKEREKFNKGSYGHGSFIVASKPHSFRKSLLAVTLNTGQDIPFRIGMAYCLYAGYSGFVLTSGYFIFKLP